MLVPTKDIVGLRDQIDLFEIAHQLRIRVAGYAYFTKIFGRFLNRIIVTVLSLPVHWGGEHF